MYQIDTRNPYPNLLGRIAELGLRQADVAVHLGIHPTLFNAILRGRRPAPKGFAVRAHASLDDIQEERQAAQEAVEKLRAERAERAERADRES